MDKIDQLRSGDHRRPAVTDDASFAALASDLTALVDQLERDRDAHRPFDKIAAHVHQLRERTQRLFSDRE